MNQGERKKRMELDEKVNVLVVELEREKNVRENAEVEARNLRKEVDRLKRRVEEVRNNVGEGGRSGNGIEQVILNNVRTTSEEGTGKQGEWIKVKGGSSKKVENPKGIDVKNRFSTLDQMDEESSIVRQREDGTNDVVLGDSKVRDLGIELSNIRRVRARRE